MSARSAKRPMGHLELRKPAAAVLLIAGLLGLGWLIWVVNIERSCTLRQWPELARCPAAIEASASRADATALAARLRARTARNPGDSEAWIALAQAALQAGAADQDSALDNATRLAPQDQRNQRLQASRALQQANWPQAVHWLMRLIEDNADGGAALAMATLVGVEPAMEAMKAGISPSQRWLGPTIEAMERAGQPSVRIMPLVVKALPYKGVPPALAQRLIKDLKAGGLWMEAHSLWLASLGQAQALVFNGSFESGFREGGFDWEASPAPPGQGGYQLRQLEMPGHGGVLQLEFTGRPIAVPIVLQHVVLLEKRYRFTGEFMSSGLRSAEGLVWVFQCTGPGGEVARTQAIQDTGRQWKTITAEITLPAGCGPAVSLQLQTFAAYESVAGMRGQASFDNFRLESLP
ncbi:MAG: hypothetical protein V4731_12580 [Pseudomonadota bacterium]